MSRERMSERVWMGERFGRGRERGFVGRSGGEGRSAAVGDEWRNRWKDGPMATDGRRCVRGGAWWCAARVGVARVGRPRLGLGAEAAAAGLRCLRCLSRFVAGSDQWCLVETGEIPRRRRRQAGGRARQGDGGRPLKRGEGRHCVSHVDCARMRVCVCGVVDRIGAAWHRLPKESGLSRRCPVDGGWLSCCLLVSRLPKGGGGHERWHE